GWLEGKRIRKNFPTRAEAMAERQTLEIQRIQSDTGVRTAATRLSDEQLHEAEAAFRRVARKVPLPVVLSRFRPHQLPRAREPEVSLRGRCRLQASQGRRARTGAALRTSARPHRLRFEAARRVFSEAR